MPPQPKHTVLDIVALSHEFRGIARAQGKTLFVEGGLPGERVRARCLSQKKRFEEWQTLEVINSAPERTIPFCEYVDRCGGCQWQYCDHGAQVVFKQQQMLDQLQRFGRAIPEQILPAITGPTLGYRRRARLSYYVDKQRKSVHFGFREKNSKAIIDIQHCGVLEPCLDRLIAPLSSLLRERFGQRLHIGHVELLAEESQGTLHPVVLVRMTEFLAKEDRDLLIQFAAAEACSVFVQVGEVAEHLAGPCREPIYRLPEESLTLGVSANDFLQGNRLVNQRLVAAVVDRLKLSRDDNVVEFYAGMGNFSLAVAKHCAQVTGFEGSADLVNKATDNAKHNHIPNTQFVTADLTTWPRHAAVAKGVYTKVLLDPPREGAESIVAGLTGKRCQRVVYVSCNPSTLARDASVLLDNGFILESVSLVDMFPHTQHSEALAVFRAR